MATLNFKGKPFVQNYHLSVKHHQLIPRKNESLTKKITAPDGSILEGCWFRSKKRFKQEVATGEIRLVKTSDGTWSVQFKQRMGEGRKPRSLMHDTAYKSNNAELDSLGLQDFPDPKPVFLLSARILYAA